MRNAGLDEVQAVIKIARRNINNLRYADDTALMAESEEELRSLLIKVPTWPSVMTQKGGREAQKGEDMYVSPKSRCMAKKSSHYSPQLEKSTCSNQSQHSQN